MVRGNWQKRVETAQARKDATKQRKQRRNENQTSKHQMSSFLSELDKTVGNSSNFQPKFVHLWTEMNSQTSETAAEETPTKKIHPPWKEKRNDSGKKHPRTRNANPALIKDTSSTMEDSNYKQIFFSGTSSKKNSKSKKSKHAISENKTLADIVLSSSKKHSEALSASSSAIDSDSFPKLHHVSIPFKGNNKETLVSNVITQTLSLEKCSLFHVCYIAIPGHLLYDKFRGGSICDEDQLQTLLMESTSRSRSNSIAANIDTLDTTQSSPEGNHEQTILKLPAIVLDTIAIFLPDVYAAYLPKVCHHWRLEIGTTSPFLWTQLLLRNGWNVPEINSTLSTSSSISSLHALSSPNAIMSTSATIPMTPHLLSPMAISQLGSSPMTSPSQLISPLQSPNFDPPSFQSPGKFHPPLTQQTPSQLYRRTYLSHYQICRDLRAATFPIRQLLDSKSIPNPTSTQNQSTSHVSNYLTATQSFKASPNSPDTLNHCISLKNFDDTRVLAAYNLDGTLRLFESHPTSTRCTCRQVVCLRALPKTYKKNRFRLMSMDVDDTNIGCICEVDKNYSIPDEDEFLLFGARTEILLTIISREDLLCAAGGSTADLEEEHSLMVVNLTYGVLDYLDKTEFLDEEDRSEMQVKVLGNVMACREGHFCFVVSIRRPSHVPPSVHEPMLMIVDHKVCVFSKSANQIIKMYNVPTELHPHTHSPMIALASSTASNWSSDGKQRRRQLTSIALVSNVAPSIYVLKVHRRGTSTHPQLVQHSDVGRIELESEGWRSLTTSPRIIAVLASNQIVVGDSYEMEGHFGARYQSVLTVYSIGNDQEHEEVRMESNPWSMPLEGNCNLICMEPIGETYVVVICRQKKKKERPLEYGGQWFEEDPDDADDPLEVLEARIIHVGSMQEIDRMELMPSEFWNSSTEPFPFLFAGSMSSMTMGLSWHGMVITGSAVRDAFYTAVKKAASIMEEEAKSGKKKRTPRTKIAMHRNKNKKDGFARGMRSM